MAFAGAIPYQVLLLGAETEDRAHLQSLVEARLADLGLEADAITFVAEADAPLRDNKMPTMAVYFGHAERAYDTPLLTELIEESIVIAPIVSDLERCKVELPPQLIHVNAIAGGDASGLSRLASLVLEHFRLLRRERRIFISYRRIDSQPLADRLYDALDARGFDVFIDVRSVPPAVDFQSMLWHRMSDCDVVLLIDTPRFRQSRWTVEELARANATNIQILHVLWPGQDEDAASSFSHFLKLSADDFWSFIPLRGRWLKRKKLSDICNEAERLRARAIAWRHRYLLDNFCDAARDLGFTPAVQPERWILLNFGKGQTLAVVPAVGVPTSDRINDIFDEVSDRKPAAVWVIYDSRGVLESWLGHLEWLDTHLPIRTVQMSRVPALLQNLDP